MKIDIVQHNIYDLFDVIKKVRISNTPIQFFYIIGFLFLNHREYCRHIVNIMTQYFYEIFTKPLNSYYTLFLYFYSIGHLKSSRW